MLYENKPRDTSNDPIMLNKKGFRVRVPEYKVNELLNKGFKLEDKGWTPTVPEEFITRHEPLPYKELIAKLDEQKDILETTEI